MAKRTGILTHNNKTTVMNNLKRIFLLWWYTYPNGQMVKGLLFWLVVIAIVSLIILWIN